MESSKHQEFVIGILETGMLIDQVVQKSLKQYNLTHAQYNVLRILNGSFPEALCMKDVKDKMILPASDLTRLADRLESKDLIIRGQCPKNRRKINVMITPKGQELLIESWPRLKLNLKNFFSEDLTSKEIEHAIDSLLKLKDGLKQQIYAQY